MNNQAKYIAIEGVIGVGKTTLARMISPYFDASVLLEVFEENPFLADFYHDRERYAFQTQLFFLLSRYQQQNQAVPDALRRGTLISDYTFAKDELFAWINLRDDELAMYGRVHSALGEQIRQPDLLVYLTAEHETVMKRIALRDRPYERDMDPEYIRELAKSYQAWLANLQEIPVLIIDVTDLDFLAKKEDLEHVVTLVQEALRENGGKPAILPDLAQEPNRYLPQKGSLANYQEFHRHLDRMKSFDPDLFFNFVLMSEELGEIAGEMVKVWRTAERLRTGVRQLDRPSAVSEAVQTHKATLRRELADMLAYILKVANYTGIDLEKAYLEKMHENIHREWS